MWNRTTHRLPNERTIVAVKIDDEDGTPPRNVGRLLYHSGMWWVRDGSMYVYYVPTHWREIR